MININGSRVCPTAYIKFLPVMLTLFGALCELQTVLQIIFSAGLSPALEVVSSHIDQSYLNNVQKWPSTDLQRAFHVALLSLVLCLMNSSQLGLLRLLIPCSVVKKCFRDLQSSHSKRPEMEEKLNICFIWSGYTYF